MAVKQNNALITWKLLYFGANALQLDSQGCAAFACAEGQKMIQIFEKFDSAPDCPSRGRLRTNPPPRGFEEFFAKLAKDPLVKVPNCEAEWLKQLGGRRLRRTD